MIWLRVARTSGVTVNGLTYLCPALECRRGQPVTVDDLGVPGGPEVLVLFTDATHAIAQHRAAAPLLRDPQTNRTFERRLQRRLEALNAARAAHFNPGAHP